MKYGSECSAGEFNKICKRGDRDIEEGDELREKPNGKMNVRFRECTLPESQTTHMNTKSRT